MTIASLALLCAGMAGLPAGDGAGVTPVPSSVSGQNAKDKEDAIPQEYVAFMQRIAESLEAGDPEPMNQALDLDAFVAEVTADLGLKKDLIKGFENGLKSSLLCGSKFVDAGKAQGGLSVHFLRCVKTSREFRGLLRINYKNGGCAWIELFLNKKKDGTIVYTDFYSTTTGAPISQTIRQMSLPLFAQELHQTSEGKKQADLTMESIEYCLKIKNLAQSQKPKEAFALYQSLPDAIRRDYLIQLNASVAAQMLGSDSPEYNSLLNDIYQSNGNNPGAQMMLIDYFFLKKQFDKARECNDALAQRYAPDGMLCLYQGNTFVQETNYSEAIRRFREGRATEPRLAKLYDAEAACHLATQDFIALRDLWTDFQKAYPKGDIVSALKNIDSYREFVASAEFAELTEDCAKIRSAAAKPAEEK